MKVLHLNTFFRLPDDFVGNDVNDALRELIKYREAKSLTEMKSPIPGPPELTPAEDKAYSDHWARFWGDLHLGFRHTGYGNITVVEDPASPPPAPAR